MASEIIAILEPVLGEELARDIVAHRKGLKCPLTPRGARSLLKQYELTGRPVEAAEEHLNRGWQGFKAEWMTRPQRFQDERNPTPKTSANYGNPANESTVIPKPMSEEDRIRRSELAAKARAVVGSAKLQGVG